jgi:LuxR family transcriptional regulator
LQSAEFQRQSDVLGSFAANLETSADLDEAMDVLQDVASALGFPLVDYACIPCARRADGSWLPPPLRTRNFPSRWDVEWDRYRADDPYYHASFRGTEIIDWADVQQKADQLSPAERDCLSYIADKGLGHGLTIPFHMAGSRFGFLSVIGDSTTDDWDLRAAETKGLLLLVAHYFHNTVSARFSPFRLQPVEELSPREAECLSWCAQGKTIEDVAAILGLSGETVRIYMKRVSRKLNAVNRAHAVAKACFLGLIDPPG